MDLFVLELFKDNALLLTLGMEELAHRLSQCNVLQDTLMTDLDALPRAKSDVLLEHGMDQFV